MYLSQLTLNPLSRRVQSELASPYEMHRSLMRSFPDDLGPGQERVLFRVDQNRRTGMVSLLVQSLTPPDWSWLAEPNSRGYLLPMDEPNPTTKPFDPSFRLGQVLAFRLRANPTKKLSLGRNNKRVGLYRESEQLQWLFRKAEAGGFEILGVRTRQEGRVRSVIHRGDKATYSLNLLAVTFDGFLRVTDPENLLRTVKSGIGSGKSFGFGLLSLAPATSS